MPLTIPEFVARWQGIGLSERSAAQQHFLDLCQVLGQPTPAAADPTGSFYTFEKGVAKTGGGKGFADVWKRGYFAWEYKGPHRDLVAAYRQLQQYREDLESPPLLVVCDLDRFEVHTNYTGTVKQVYAFSLADLATPEPTPTSALPPLEVLRALFAEPARLRPRQTTEQVTELAAREFARLAESLRSRGEEPEAASRFLIRLLFCLFAEDVGLLPAGLFTRLVENLRTKPAVFAASLRTLFGAMAEGGVFGADVIAHFNGGPFADDAVLPLSADDLAVLGRACVLDWKSIEPAIFGTLFERSLDPAKRSQLGAHYTGQGGHPADRGAGADGPAASPVGGGAGSGGCAGGPAGCALAGGAAHPGGGGAAAAAGGLRGGDRRRAGAGPGVRQRQLPVRGLEAAARPGEGGRHVCGEERGGGVLPARRAGAAVRDRAGPVRARAGAGVGVHRLHPVAAG